MEKAYLKLLNESFNRKLTDHEREMLQSAIADDPQLQAESEKLKNLISRLGEENYAFEPYFTEKVMSRIGLLEEYAMGREFAFAFTRIALPGLAAAAILLLITILGSGSFSLDSLMGVDSLKPEYLTDFLIY